LLTVVPANQASFGDLQSIFGTRGQASRCQCQHYKLAPLETRAIDAHPMTTSHAIDEQLHCWRLTTFLDAGSRR